MSVNLITGYDLYKDEIGDYKTPKVTSIGFCTINKKQIELLTIKIETLKNY